MKYKTLTKIVKEEAFELKENAAYSGSYNDGGSSNLLTKLNDYQNGLVIKLDLRPSEFGQLNEMEVGEPEEFSSVIEKYKLKLAKELIKNIKL